MEISLSHKTGNQQVDRILQGVVGIFETVFPDRIRGYYLVGSYADGTAISTSDIDLQIIFKHRFQNEQEQEKARQIWDSCWWISPIGLDTVILSEERILSRGSVSVKLVSLLVYGEDIREKIPLPPIEEYVRQSMYRLHYFLIRVVRKNLKVLTIPLDYPDPEGECYGYDYRIIIKDGLRLRSPKGLINITGRIASAMIASQTKQYVASKNHCLKLYREYINDEWTSLLEEIEEKCRTRWEYLMPKDKEDLKQLRAICQQTLAFENHFLTTTYKDYLLAELLDADDSDKLVAVKRLGEVIYPDDEEVYGALGSLARSDNAELQEAVKETIEKISKVQEKQPFTQA